LNFFEFEQKKETEKKRKTNRKTNKKGKSRNKKKSDKWARPIPDQGCAVPGWHRPGWCIGIPELHGRIGFGVRWAWAAWETPGWASAGLAGWKAPLPFSFIKTILFLFILLFVSKTIFK
jgi:hypothetical protein